MLRMKREDLIAKLEETRKLWVERDEETTTKHLESELAWVDRCRRDLSEELKTVKARVIELEKLERRLIKAKTPAAVDKICQEPAPPGDWGRRWNFFKNSRPGCPISKTKKYDHAIELLEMDDRPSIQMSPNGANSLYLSLIEDLPGLNETVCD